MSTRCRSGSRSASTAARSSNATNTACRRRIELDGQLLYIDDTGAQRAHGWQPRRAATSRWFRSTRAIRAVSRCPAPSATTTTAAGRGRPFPAGAVATIRLLDVSEPEQSEQRDGDGRSRTSTEFPIEFELPHDGVSVDRHRRYELEATITLDGRVLFDDDVHDAQRMVPFRGLPEHRSASVHRGVPSWRMTARLSRLRCDNGS